MLKKILIIGLMMGICLMFIIPSDATPDEVILDDQVELSIPGTFELIDADHDRKGESIKFKLEIKAYREGDFIVTGNLEGKKKGEWLGLATTVVPYKWSPDNSVIEMTFATGNIQKYRISGPYRVNVSLKEGNWVLPEQVAGFSPEYSWKGFENTSTTGNGEVKTLSEAERAAQTWAEYHSVELGKLIDIDYNYDNWQVDYQARRGDSVFRFLVSPQGMVKMMKIAKR
ncbi:MAG: hypothetical protein ACM3YE_14955 [Bacteroidota bacterium]